jgi:winged helix DNA-binding protein
MLHKPERLGAGDAVRRLLAVQAQDLRGARLALRARTTGLTARDVDAALDRAELVVSWLCRGTLHMVHRDDFAWIHALTAPPIATMNRRRLEQEGVKDPERAVRVVLESLGDGPQLRSELAERVATARIQTNGQAMVHILLKATLEGHVVRGPFRGREQTFALTADWLGNTTPKIDRDQALAELARRYLAAHAPADAADLARWAGITLGDARAGLRAIGDQPAKSPPRRIPPRLLGQFDPYVLGWKDRSFAVPREHEKTLLPGGGMFRAVAIDDGLVLGDWDAVASDARFARERADVERFLA